jgi:hypothetical protein
MTHPNSEFDMGFIQFFWFGARPIFLKIRNFKIFDFYKAEVADQF